MGGSRPPRRRPSPRATPGTRAGRATDGADPRRSRLSLDRRTTIQLYLVKWEDGTFALVSADDDLMLVDILDQLGDPGVASWQVYEGPLWLEFPRIDEGVPPDEDIDPIELGIGRPSVAPTDVGSEFADAVLAAVHPNLAALRELARNGERAISRAEFDAALRADRDHALPVTVYGEGEGPGD